MMIFEATCLKCWETFNPQPSLSDSDPTALADPDAVWMNGRGFTVDDMRHAKTQHGTDCGGDGQLEGAWVPSQQ